MLKAIFLDPLTYVVNPRLQFGIVRQWNSSKSFLSLGVLLMDQPRLGVTLLAYGRSLKFSRPNLGYATRES